MNDTEVAKALFAEGLTRLDAGDWLGAEASFRKTLELRPQSVPTLSNLAFVLTQQGRVAEARECAERAATIDDRDPGVLMMLANCLAADRAYAATLAACDRLLALAPNIAEAHSNRGFALKELGRFPEALESYDAAVRHAPDFVTAHVNRGALLNRLQRYGDGLESYERALSLAPGHADAMAGWANALSGLGRHDEAIAAYDRLLFVHPGSAEVWLRRGRLLVARGRFGDALEAFARALELAPDKTETLVAHADALAELQRLDEALSCYDRALALQVDAPGAWLGKANVFAARKQNADAFAAFHRALQVQADRARAHTGLGNLHLVEFRYDQAFVAYDNAFALEPDLPDAQGVRLHAKLHLCDWRDLAAERECLLAAVRSGAQAAPPLAVLGLSDLPADQLACARIAVAAGLPSVARPTRLQLGMAEERVRVAYLSPDMHDHPVGFLLAGVFEQHDRARFEMFIVSYGPERDGPMRTRIKRAAEHFLDVRAQGDAAIAERLRALRIDVAVDLAGHTVGARPGILAAGVAGVQVGYLGYPATSGAPWLDYILADRFVIPEGDERHFSEKVVCLPESFQANDDRRPRPTSAVSREALGLPGHGLVLCNFNHSAKLTPEVFDIWMRLLKEIEGSVLWLLAANATAETNLRREAAARGVAPEQIVAAPRTGYEEYLARYRLADLFLELVAVQRGHHGERCAVDGAAGGDLRRCRVCIAHGGQSAACARPLRVGRAFAGRVRSPRTRTVARARAACGNQGTARPQPEDFRAVRYSAVYAPSGTGIPDDVRTSSARGAAGELCRPADRGIDAWASGLAGMHLTHRCDGKT